ncbi:MAG: Gfo/Idh/MocA family oxidoreductase [Actinomycetota bacterium]|nr:Gfo/Idh/MocA family oxidoreductase [Actinomycetota bacterium]
MSAPRPLRVAVIGYGLAGSAFHAPLIASTEGLALAAVVTGNPQRREAALGRYPSVEVLGSSDELWQRAGDVDLVVVASPNSSHVPLAEAALRAGLPVVVDKPVAAAAEEARQLRDLAAARGLLISVYQNRRWDGDFRTVRALVAEGALGRVHRFESRFERWRPDIRPGAWRERPEPEVAGGLLYDLGSHLIDQALVLSGPVDAVYAEVRRVRPGAQVDDDVFVALRHAGGTESHLWASSVAADTGPRLRVLGSAGAYVKHGMDVQEAALVGGGSPADAEWGVEPETAWGRLGTPGAERRVPTLPGAYQDYYAGIRDALLSGGAPPVTIDEAVEVLSVIEAAQARL